MVPIHIWCSNHCQSLEKFDKNFQAFTQNKSCYSVPIVHCSLRRLSTDHLVRISYAILQNRESPNLQVLVLTDRDDRLSNENYLTNSIQTICGLADFCSGTSILCIDLLNESSPRSREVKLKLKTIVESSSRNYIINLGAKLEPSDYLVNDELSEFGRRKLQRSLIKAITEFPTSALLE